MNNQEQEDEIMMKCFAHGIEYVEKNGRVLVLWFRIFSRTTEKNEENCEKA